MARRNVMPPKGRAIRKGEPNRVAQPSTVRLARHAPRHPPSSPLSETYSRAANLGRRVSLEEAEDAFERILDGCAGVRAWYTRKKHLTWYSAQYGGTALQARQPLAPPVPPPTPPPTPPPPPPPPPPAPVLTPPMAFAPEPQPLQLEDAFILQDGPVSPLHTLTAFGAPPPRAPGLRWCTYSLTVRPDSARRAAHAGGRRARARGRGGDRVLPRRAPRARRARRRGHRCARARVGRGPAGVLGAARGGRRVGAR